MAAFGQAEFGQYHIWPNLTGRIWPTSIGRMWPILFDRIWPDHIWPNFFWCGVVGCSLWGCGGHGGTLESGERARRVGGPEGGEAQKFRFFFLSGRSSRGILVVFMKRQNPQMCTFGVLGLSCEAPAAPKPPGLHTTAREHQNSMKDNNTTTTTTTTTTTNTNGRLLLRPNVTWATPYCYLGQLLLWPMSLRPDLCTKTLMSLRPIFRRLKFGGSTEWVCVT